MNPLDTSPREILIDAIQSEFETREWYRLLAGHAPTPEVRARLLGLADDELIHRARLERKFRDRFDEDPPDPRPVQIEIPREQANLDMRRALKLALDRERDSESKYRFLAERAGTSEVSALLMELADTEWHHKADLEAEYNRHSDPMDFLEDM